MRATPPSKTPLASRTLASRTLASRTLVSFLLTGGLLLGLGALGCDRTVQVDATAAGLKKVPLAGESQATGKVLRPIRYRENVLVPEGAQLRVEETWLIRTDGNKEPPGYRLKGLYDPTTTSDGLMLPRHSVETFYFGAVLPKSKQRAAIPARYFEKEK